MERSVSIYLKIQYNIYSKNELQLIRIFKKKIGNLVENAVVCKKKHVNRSEFECEKGRKETCITESVFD